MQNIVGAYFLYFIRLLIVSAIPGLAGCVTSYTNPVMPKEPERLSQITAHTGVRVGPIDGVPAEFGHVLAQAVSAALRELDIPAIAAPGVMPGAHGLAGKAVQEPNALSVTWTLTGPDEKPVAEYTLRETVHLAALADDPALKALAERAALAIVPYFNTAGGNALDATTVWVRAISGAPGDGDVVLPQALRRALTSAGVNVIKTDDPKAVQIEGRVQVSDLNASAQLLKLSWRVLGPGGEEIGVIDQENQVAPGQIDTHWGEIAYLAADGAKDGIIDLLSEYRAHANPSPPP